MIELKNVVKHYETRHGLIKVLNGINLHVNDGEKVGILGRNGAGKSTLIRLIGGVENPTSGSVIRTTKLSWPLAFGGGFQGSLTGFDNLRFICRLYGVSPDDKVAYVQEFAELGKYLWEPVKTYSSGMKSRLAFAISMVIDFDCFLVDEVIAVGDARFRQKCHDEVFVKRKDRGMILVSHEVSQIKAFCSRACVLHQGLLFSFDNVDSAYQFYSEIF